MCGIIGFFNYSNAENLAKSGLAIMANRGSDNSSIFEYEKAIFGHNLHSIVGYVKQPLISEKGILVINCEIYNWKELSKKHGTNSKNDAELVLSLFDKKGIGGAQEIIEELDGDFALAYYSKKEKSVVLSRDVAGVKPLVYSFNKKEKKLAFASEKKALPFDSVHLNPRKIIVFDLKKATLKQIEQKIIFKKTQKGTEIELCRNMLVESVSKRVPQKEFAVLFSGGIDSVLISKMLKTKNVDFPSVFSYVEGISEPKDLLPAEKAASFMQINLLKAGVSLTEFENELPKIISLTESIDPVRIGIASTIYFASKKVSEANPKIKVVFSGLGADELFAGYDRFKRSTNINKDCYSYFIKMYENDLYFQDIVCMYNKLELRVPFLDKEIISLALALNPELKLNKKTFENKIILRKIASELGLSKEICARKKKAAQYGSNFDKAIDLLAKRNNYSSKSDYLKSLQKESVKNVPIAALISTGKDSIYAMNLMQKQGYEIKCLITIQSSNPDSFMFHTPTIKLAKLQAEALGLPLIIAKTSGEKEKELVDLEKAIALAIKEYNVEGICSGAIFSNYQRERIEKICEKTGVRSFSPLWQSNQLSYLHSLVDSGFECIITKIAAFGFDESWVGKKIDSFSIKKLEALKKRYGINPAGEGGEYESLVLDTPFFKKKIVIQFEKVMQNEFTGEIKIISAKLEEK